MFFTMIGAGFMVEALGINSLRSFGPMLAGYSFPILLALFVTGTFLEELIFRGYIIERIIMLTNNRKLAAFISWAAFTVVHFRFFGLGPTIETGVMAAFLTGLYLKERSVWPVIIVHGLNGLFAYILVPMFF